MAAYRVTDAQLTALANTIRSKGGTNEALQFPGGFLQAIRAISGGGAGGGLDTSDADAAAGDIRSGKTAYVNGEKLTGTLVPGEYVMVTGTKTIDEEEEMILTVLNVPFTAEGAIVWHTASYSTHYYVRGEQTLLFAVGSPVAAGTTGLCYDYGLTGFKGNAYAGMQIFQNGSTVRLFADAYYNGPYRYLIWGHPTAQA